MAKQFPLCYRSAVEARSDTCIACTLKSDATGQTRNLIFPAVRCTIKSSPHEFTDPAKARIFLLLSERLAHISLLILIQRIDISETQQWTNLQPPDNRSDSSSGRCLSGTCSSHGRSRGHHVCVATMFCARCV